MKLYLDDIRNPHQSGYKDNNVCKVLYDCLLECFKIDLKCCI